MSNPVTRQVFFLTGVFFAIWLVLLASGRQSMLRDPGTFWHVTTGQRILDSGGVPRVDPYSFTRAGQPWVDDQWLAECGMAWLYHRLGWDGLLLATATLLAVTYTWLAARLVGAGLHALPALLLLAVAILAGAPQFHLRPLVLTLGLFGLTFAMLVDVEAGRHRRRQLGWLVPLFVFWANGHGGVLAGLGTVALCVGGWCVVWLNLGSAGVPPAMRNLHEPPAIRNAGETPALLLLVVTLALATLVNPYGLRLPEEWWTTLSMPLPEIINEHARLPLGESVGWATLSLAAVFGCVLLGTRRGQSHFCGDHTTAWYLPQKSGHSLPRLRVTWLVPLVWFVLALQRVRNAPLFAVAATIALADALPHCRLGEWLARHGMFSPPHRPAVKPGRRAWLGLVPPLAAVTVAFAIQFAGIAVPIIGRGWVRFDPARWPMDLLPALEAIDRSGPQGTPIFNDLNFGGFLIAHTPRLRVFVDDRCSVYGSDFLLAYERARREDPARIDGWRRQYGFRYALVESRGRFDRYLTGNRWALIGRSPAAALYQFGGK